jgi:hypothetical protein
MNYDEDNEPEPDFYADDDYQREFDDDMEETEGYLMKIGEWVAGSCAAYAIQNLGSHKNALQAMHAFCKQTLGRGEESRYGVKTFEDIATHYIFIAGPEEGNKGHSKKWIKYGTEFAQFILDHQLGTVTTLPAKVNLKHHPDTTCQVWLWQPNQSALEGWYADLLDDLKTNPPVISAYRASLTSDDRCPQCGNRKIMHDMFWNCPYGGEWPDQPDPAVIPIKKKVKAPPKDIPKVLVQEMV